MRALLILGMHRSGTSALAGQCASLGLGFGDNLLPPRPDNAKGYFEDIDVMLTNDQLVTLLFGSWHSPVAWAEVERSFPLDHPRIIELLESLRTILKRIDASGRSWAVKDPRLSRLLPIWWPLIRSMDPNAGIAMAIRRPSEVVASLERRDCLGITTARLLWLRHVAEPLAYALDHKLQMAVVPYEQLLHSPARLADQLRLLGLHLEQQGPVFVDEALRHHHHESVPHDDLLTDMCEELYQMAVSVPIFGRDSVSPAMTDLIRAARDLPLSPYVDRLYYEAMGVSSTAQRLFQERRKAVAQAQNRALRQRLQKSEKALERCREELSRLRPAVPKSNASRP